MDQEATVAIIGLLKLVENRNTTDQTWTNLQNADGSPVVEVYFIRSLKNGEAIEWKRPTQGNPDIFSRPLWIYTTQDALEWLPTTLSSEEWKTEPSATHYLLDSRWEPDPAGSDGLRKLNVRAVYTFREGEDEYRCARDISSGRSDELCTP
jgi:hypothetical protein